MVFGHPKMVAACPLGHLRTDPVRGAEKHWEKDDRLHGQVYAGRADSSDPSRFSIRYEVAGQWGVIRGCLHDDDSVEMEDAEGPGLSTWWINIKQLLPMQLDD